MLIVGIAGGSGSGKTTVVKKIMAVFPNDEVRVRYHDTVKPSHLQFIEPSKRYADIIIPRGGENQVGIDVLTSIIEKHLSNNKS